ncbi:fatty acid-binding protein DegV [Fervidicella metallireducens AeB]|uniref:Fatty acid-binding protein DegV n=1 Tax=Fervidicella metallireducens AeB TaxID=1403537 RepID=A0A017RX82_9CLOT|nr:DegV family protein [Fervidicella metallireducens]EYE89388.1 fatty acid-binding protein DegV [Fervidicella metallireducens AeB]
MAKIRVVVDSTAYFTKEYVSENNIDVVQLKVEFGGVTKDEGFPGEFEEFYNKLKNSTDFPVTSQPPVGAFVKVFQDAVDNGEEVITLTFSSKLSGTYNCAKLAAEMVAPDKITVIDSESAVAVHRFLAEIAVDLAKEGKTREEIIKAIEDQKTRMGIHLTVGSLEYMKRGGRLSGAKALVGTLLNIKPIIGLVDGLLIPVEKVRGKNKAIEMMISKIPDDVKKISIGQVLNMEEANRVKAILEEKFKDAEVTIYEVGPVIGSHLGPETIGLCYIW